MNINHADEHEQQDTAFSHFHSLHRMRDSKNAQVRDHLS